MHTEESATPNSNVALDYVTHNDVTGLLFQCGVFNVFQKFQVRMSDFLSKTLTTPTSGMCLFEFTSLEGGLT